MRGMGSYGGIYGSEGDDISEIGDEATPGADKKYGGFAPGSWIESSPFGENFGRIKRDYQVRRTRISERMRKRQELVPNMDKQTNTADKLDLVVDYIKDLQKQFKALSTNRANFKCVIMKKPVPDWIISVDKKSSS